MCGNCINATCCFVLFFSGYRGDDCGFCPPGLPGHKGERGDSGKRSYQKFKHHINRMRANTLIFHRILKIGRSGLIGPQGIRGRTGMRGLKGAQGRPGLQGFKGFYGINTLYSNQS